MVQRTWLLLVHLRNGHMQCLVQHLSKPLLCLRTKHTVQRTWLLLDLLGLLVALPTTLVRLLPLVHPLVLLFVLLCLHPSLHSLLCSLRCFHDSETLWCQQCQGRCGGWRVEVWSSSAKPPEARLVYEARRAGTWVLCEMFAECRWVSRLRDVGLGRAEQPLADRSELCNPPKVKSTYR